MIGRTSLLAALSAALLCASSAQGDTYVRSPRELAISADGRTYALLGELHRPGRRRYTVHARPTGAPALTPAQRIALNSTGRALDGDTEIRSGRLRCSVDQALVSADGAHLVTLHDAPVALRIHRAPAEPIEVRLDALFTAAERASIPTRFATPFWREVAWIDDEAQLCVVMAKGRTLRAVSLIDGSVGPLPDVRLRAAVLSRPRTLAHLLLEVIVRRGPDGWRETLVEVARSDARPSAVRGDALVRLALFDLPDAEVRELASVVGARGLAWSCAHVRPVHPSHRHRRSDRALPEYNAAAARVVGLSGVPHLSPALAEAAAGSDVQVAIAAVEALSTLGGEGAAKSLRGLLSREPLHLPLALHYAKVKDSQARRPLVDALERQREINAEGEVAAAILNALEFQTGVFVGKDPQAWRYWLDR